MTVMKNISKFIGVECLECGQHSVMSFPLDSDNPVQYWSHNCDGCKKESRHIWVAIPEGALWVSEDTNYSELNDGFYLMGVSGEFTPAGCLCVSEQFDKNTEVCQVIMEP